jgi:hypothetical protein
VVVQPPVVALAVIIYCTLPAVVLLGFVRTWAIVAPVPELAPVIPPVIVPTVQVYVLGTLELIATDGAVPLHTATFVAVITGNGFTVTKTLAVVVQPPVVALAVIIYCTLPAVVFGFVSTCAIVAPVPELAPVIPPVIVPTVHV